MTDEHKKNLEFWFGVEKTPAKYVKQVSYGARSFHTIDAHYQIMRATAEWGKYGDKWKVFDEKYTEFGQRTILYQAKLMYPDGVFDIHADIQIANNKGRYNEDWSKKVATDALTKGLSKLGFSADVFMGAFDNNKYAGALNE